MSPVVNKDVDLTSMAQSVKFEYPVPNRSLSNPSITGSITGSTFPHGGNRGYHRSDSPKDDTLTNLKPPVQKMTGNYHSVVSPYPSQLLFSNNCSRIPGSIPLQLHQVLHVNWLTPNCIMHNLCSICRKKTIHPLWCQIDIAYAVCVAI